MLFLRVRKPGSGQCFGAAELLYSHQNGRWPAPVSVGTRIPESAGGSKAGEKEEVEGTPAREAWGPHFPGLSPFLFLQVVFVEDCSGARIFHSALERRPRPLLHKPS